MGVRISDDSEKLSLSNFRFVRSNTCSLVSSSHLCVRASQFGMFA